MPQICTCNPNRGYICDLCYDDMIEEVDEELYPKDTETLLQESLGESA